MYLHRETRLPYPVLFAAVTTAHSALLPALVMSSQVVENSQAFLGADCTFSAAELLSLFQSHS